ncbi:MAG: T9SS type A sorting domain-containing protein [Ignavibacteriales bacterium]|nr:T9SS type A sorting domain-containing protein [Ignavibacteriales bacterium]
MTASFRHIVFFLLCVIAGGRSFAQLTTVYVDAANGSDVYTGANPANSPAGTGPKSTIHAALGTIANNGTLVILAGIYAGDGVDTDGSPSIITDNADIDISSAKYPRLTSGLTIELRSLGTNNEIRIQVDAGSVLAANGALINHAADDYIPSFIVNIPGGTVRITSATGTEYLNLAAQHTSGTPTSGIILKAGDLGFSDSSLVRLKNNSAIALYGTSTFTDKVPAKQANLSLSYFGDGTFTAGPESRYGNYGSGVLLVNKTAGSGVTFTAPMSFAGVIIPTGGIVGLVPNKAITVSSGSAVFENAISLGSIGSSTAPATVSDILLTGTGSATFNGTVSLVVGGGAVFADYSLSSIENQGSGTLQFNAPVTWSAAWNAAGLPLSSLTFGTGSGTALARNASGGTIRFGSSVTLATNTIGAQTGDAYFSVIVENDGGGTLSFDQGIAAPNTPGAISGNRNFTVHALNVSTGTMNISGQIRGKLSNTGASGGVININGPTTVSLLLENTSGKRIALGTNTLTLARIVGPPFLNDGNGGTTTPLTVNHNTSGGLITGTIGTLLMSHGLGIATFNGGTFSSLTCDGIGGTTQLLSNGFNIDNLLVTGGTLNIGVNSLVNQSVSLSNGLLTLADGTTLQTGGFAQTGGTSVIGSGAGGSLKVTGDFTRSGGEFNANNGSTIEIGGLRPLTFAPGSSFQVYDIIFNNPGSSVSLVQSARVSHLLTVSSGTTLNLSSSDLIINGDNATVNNAGIMTGENGSLVFGGAATAQGGRSIPGAVLNSTGPGLYTSLRIDVGSGNRVRGSGTIRFSRLLDMTSGAFEITSGDISPSAATARVVRNVVASPGIIASGGAFNSLGISYDLEYTGTLNSTIAPGVDLTPSVRNWLVNVNADPNLDGDSDITTGTRYYVQIPGTADYNFDGTLTIGPSAAVRLGSGPGVASLLLSASNATHTVRGILTTSDVQDQIVVSGSNVTIAGSTASAEPALLGNTTISSTSCTIKNIQGLAGNLTTNPGSSLVLGMGSSTSSSSKLASEQIIAGAVTLNGSSFTLASNLEVQAGVVFSSGLFNFDIFNLALSTSGNFVQNSGAAGYNSAGGYLVMNRANSSLTIGNSIGTALPNLRVLSNIILAAPGRINGNLDIGTPASAGIPVVRLGSAGNDLTLAGSAITLSSDGTGNAAAILSDGTSNGTAGGKLVIVSQSSTIIANSDFSIEELTYNPEGGTGTLSFVSTSGSPRTFTISEMLTQMAGDINLGANHLVLLGTGSNVGVRSFNRTSGSILATSGEVRFEGGALQRFSPGNGLVFPNLKINNSIGVSSSSPAQAFVVSRSLDLARGALTVDQGALQMADGSTIIRRQSGALLSSAPAFGNSVNISYLIDPANGSLTTSSEVPVQGTIVQRLRINNPSLSAGSAGVILGRSMSIRDTLFLEAGALVKGQNEVTVGNGGTILMGGGSFDTTGTRSGAPAVSSYNLVYRTGTTVASTDRDFQAGNGIRILSLSVLSSADSKPTVFVLHANRSVGDVTINSEGGGLALGPAGSLASRTFEISGNVIVRAGAFLSSTGRASLIDLAGTAKQSITVPPSGLLLTGGTSSINLRLNNPAGFVLQGGNLAFGPSAVLFFVKGILQTSDNALVLSQTSGGQGFDRSGVVKPSLSYVQGRVRHNVVGGAGSPTVYPNGRYEFPVGTSSTYRPLSIVFGTSYPAIIATTIDVEQQDGNPGGSSGLPLDGGSGIRIGNYPSFSWVVTTGANGFASNQRYDLEVQSPDPGLQSVRTQDLRLIHRLEAGGASNPWSLQGGGSSYFGNEMVTSGQGDTTYVVRAAFSLGTVTIQGQRLTLGVPTKPPVFVKSLADTTIAEGQSLEFTFGADPKDLGETIAFSLISSPSGASIDGATGLFKWRPSFGQAGSYSIVVSAFDGQFLIVSSATVTVRRVNRPPVFTSVLRDTTIRDTRDTLRFTYAATDPEGDAVLFTLVSGPPGLTLTNAGLLRWAATSQQANQSYLVKVMVSDGVQSDSTSALVTVTRNRSRGDVDGDGLITANDASLVLRHVVGLIVLTDPGALFAADASRDGTITPFDASLILQAAAGLIVIPTFSIQTAPPGIAPPASADAQSSTATLAWSLTRDPKTPAEVHISLNVSSSKADIFAVQWNIQGDLTTCPVNGVLPTLPEGWQMIHNSTDRELRIVAIGTTPISTRQLATVTLKFAGGAERVTLAGNGWLNERTQTLSALEVSSVPVSFALEQNYPNPFNPGTTVKFRVPEKSPVQIVIYNLQGQRIRTLVDAVLEPGSFNTTWDGRSDTGELVSSGIYICRMVARSFVSTQKMMLVR